MNNNGVIKIERKGIKKFAFGDNEIFSVDVITVWQQWLIIDERFRPDEFKNDGTPNEDRSIPTEDVPAYYNAAVQFIKDIGGGEVTIAEALEFLARLKEEWSDLVSFFRPRSRDERESSDSLETPSVELQFSEETAN